MKKLLLIGIAITGIAMCSHAQEPKKQKKTPEEKAQNETDRMKTGLGLSDEQTAKVKDINLKTVQGMKELKQKFKADKKALEANSDASLKKVLSDEQYKKYMTSKEKHKEGKEQKEDDPDE